MLPNINCLIEILACVLTDQSVVVIGPPGSQEMPQSVQMCLVSSIVNSLKLLIHPILWVQTSITIVPLELLDILEAPMPYVVGVLCEHWNYFAMEKCNDADFLEDKCIVSIQPNNTIQVHSRHS
jgi:hypothetical protein